MLLEARPTHSMPRRGEKGGEEGEGKEIEIEREKKEKERATVLGVQAEALAVLALEREDLLEGLGVDEAEVAGVEGSAGLDGAV